MLLTPSCELYCAYVGQKEEFSLVSGGADHDYQLPEDAIEDTDRSHNLFTRKADRNKILWACEYICFYCLTSLHDGNFEADHLVAVISGGPHTLDNAVAACRSCNRKKGPRSHREFIEDYGGKDGISTFVRCHGYSQEKRCKNPESPGTSSYYCRHHGY